MITESYPSSNTLKHLFYIVMLASIYDMKRCVRGKIFIKRLMIYIS